MASGRKHKSGENIMHKIYLVLFFRLIEATLLRQTFLNIYITLYYPQSETHLQISQNKIFKPI